jgi:aspartate racemase
VTDLNPGASTGVVGVLGGMGPLATADFFNKVIAATPATNDAGHVPLLIHSDPRIPGRPAAILHGGPSPLPALLAARNRLIAAGAVALVMPCNTAHHWHVQLQTGCPVPFLSIVDAACQEVTRAVEKGALIGIIGTRATLAAQLFDAPLAHSGCALLLPDEQALQQVVLPAIEGVKAGRVAQSGAPLELVVQALLDRGAARVILACTEVPLALDAIESPLRAHCVDTTAALARACVAWWQQYSGPNL